MIKNRFLYLVLLMLAISCGGSNYVVGTNTSQLKSGKYNVLLTICQDDYIKIEVVDKKVNVPMLDYELKIAETGEQFTLGENGFTYKDISVERIDDGYALYKDGVLQYESMFYKYDDELEEERYYDVDNSYYGMGQSTKSLDVSGKRFVIYHEPVYGDQTYLYIPFYMTNHNQSVYYNATGYDKIKFPKDSGDPVIYTTKTGRISSYYRIGGDYQNMVSSFYKVSDSASMVPKWVFGFSQSKYGYKSSQEVLDLVDKFKTLDIKLSSVVLDLYWFEKMGDLDWDSKNFPDPVALDKRLEDDGVKLITISEPFFTTDSKNFKEFNNAGILATDKKGKVVTWHDWWCFDSTEGAIVDVFNPNTKGILGAKYVKMIQDGIDGFWTDLGEPEKTPATAIFSGVEELYAHNYYNRQWSKIIYESIVESFPDKRFFILSRSGYTGSGKYELGNWSGDVPADFEGLKEQIPQGLSSSIAGFSLWGSDVGGYTPEYANEELVLRWYQFGAFTPVFRSHGTGAREPWTTGDEYMPIIRKYIDYRYQLLPYSYSLSWQTYKEGVPMMRPMLYSDDSSIPTKYLDTQFFYGKNILVSPITNSMTFHTETKCYLPEGGWYDWETMKRYDGGKEHTFASVPESIPVFVKEASITPMDYNGEDALLVTPSEGKSGSFLFYDDDGETRDYLKGEYTEITYNIDGFNLSIDAKKYGKEVIILAPINTKMKSTGWKKSGKYQSKVVKLAENILL